MKTKTIIIWILAILGALLLLMYGGSKNIMSLTLPSDSSKVSKISEIKDRLITSEILYDFGTISMKDGDVSKTFKVTNGTSLDILIPSLTTSCMCTRAYFIEPGGNKNGPFGMQGMGVVPKLNKTIKAGESADIEVIYDPNAHGPAGVGMIDRFIYLEDSEGNKLQFEIKARVTP
ncbi:hypothetical protein CO033_02260 [Candidatus Nomurabacteria bacterium CG_4_9_14_0_2_um_filter_32_10]|uniref:DUF1573 domain-containing protein n=3 Tax=Candidatus Nomuraibacteriota TaxID=1752729 RepID=A0A2H0CGV1_9BACT|nr:MAG: hypothetical protein COW91_01700 [Candidatus Nomurabacteria bacterium CG22_combo_CG10-13_8_21_14_all_32_8]PIZ86004.1 MAG: hypothetical protein COX94_01310 [Candidatus Nomurabacteria bacterium CG_4_10_14_0_2_um_filter_33_9]PJC49287.1 MAG: hypothetical protein CO033_02260 [Candidatus Nomurabacteria bacterium CG_4_9_14_0_2_um_filter_32_10]